MKITDELRKWISTVTWLDDGMSHSHKNILAIADRIDAEYQKALDELFKALTIDMKPMTDENMAVDGWIRLPKDADGVPIRFGDKVTVPWNENVYEVRGFSYTQQLAGGERTIWVDVYSREKMGNVPLCGSSSCRHYHAPTVEDVLRELVGKAQVLSCVDDEDELVTEYAKRLTLAEG